MSNLPNAREDGICCVCLKQEAVTTCRRWCLKCLKKLSATTNPIPKTPSDSIGRNQIHSSVLGGTAELLSSEDE